MPDGDGYLALQQPQPPQSSPRQQHFSQQQDSPQQSQQPAASAPLAGVALPRRNGNIERTTKENFMAEG